MSCNMDCLNCKFDDCINDENLHDDITDKIDLEERLSRRWAKARTPQERYVATPRGYANRMKAKRKYEENNPLKRALWNFKTRFKRNKGYAPSEEECEAFLRRNGYITEG